MLCVAYRDKLGYVMENVKYETIEFLDGKAYVNDKTIDVMDIVRIGESDEKDMCGD